MRSNGHARKVFGCVFGCVQVLKCSEVLNNAEDAAATDMI
jgi:hypothetical protein